LPQWTTTKPSISDGGLFIRDGFIEQVGPTASLPHEADEVLDLSGHIVLPGLVNTHHHFYQTLTRNIPAAQDANLFNWLKTLYPIWARLNPDDIFTSAQTALAELALSGCTTASDHLYLFPNGSRLDDEIEAGLSPRGATPRLARVNVPGRIAGRTPPRPRHR
jgi:8-oxoguanine deaminase